MGKLFSIDIKNGVFKILGITITSSNINSAISFIIFLVVLFLAMYLSIKIGNKVIAKTVKKQKNMRFSLDDKKAKTMGAILSSILRYTVYFIGISALLTKLFGNISITFAGIGGAAIGFGAQSLVKDIINGFFILFEDQYVVGDYISVDNMKGIVDSIELRVTKLKDFNGDLHIIPNGMITKVTNHSRNNMRFMVEMDIAYEEDTYKATEILKEACESFKKEHENVVEGPNVVGVVALKDSGVTLRVVGKAKPMTQWDLEPELRAYLKKILDVNNVELAYPVTRIVNYDLRKEK
ncbi:mechanosensitive ion channel family protein [Clostridium sp. 19966]|uniref:mechanosensitive ion channel family protein n=1 Tax=Clostridium sp. 19966 TaxID=2768166 RepID=UPI0028DF8033|nr:mechanosensitive ion channel family protein [Clostridium sp. 19966]MDT8719309.1 mechanosensitive ion channel family protein [Clostridium sp. 19966]